MKSVHRSPSKSSFRPLTQRTSKHSTRMSLGVSSIPKTWYPLCTSAQVQKPGSIQRSQVDDVGFCVYRDHSGIVRCVSDVCPHRGAPLSMGKVVDDRIACPYHGFQFDRFGILRFIPSDPGCSTGQCPSCPSQPILPVYTIRERGGFVWVYYDPKGEEAGTPTLPLPVTPELEDPKWYLTYGEFEFDAPWQPVFENALDNSHIHFLHGSSFGNEESPIIRNMKTRAVSDTVSEATFTLTNKPVNAWWNWTAVPEVYVTARAYLPSVSTIRFELGGGISFLTYVATVPVSTNKTVNRYVLARTRFPGKLWDPMARSAMNEIFAEDRTMVEQLYPSTLYEERSVRADALQLIWRKQVRAFVSGDLTVDSV